MSTQHTPSKSREILWIIPGILIAALIWHYFPPSSQVMPPELAQATLLPQAKAIHPFELQDASGQAFTQEQLKGHWSFLFFGYTHCPDVCPTTLQTLASALKHMQASSPELPQGVFISVDPDRDNTDRLKQFVSYFDDNFIGVTGDPAQIQAFAAQLGIIYAKVINSPTEDYLVDHSAALLLFDPQGQFRALFGVPHDPETIADDFQAIKRYYEARY